MLMTWIKTLLLNLCQRLGDAFLEPVPPLPLQPYPKMIPGIDPDLASVISQINAAREREGHSLLKSDIPLMDLSEEWAEELASTGQLSHGDFGRRIWTAHPNTAAGEDIAMGQTTAEAVVSAWLADPPHRQIMMGEFDLIGVGRAKDASGTSYWVADFDQD